METADVYRKFRSERTHFEQECEMYKLLHELNMPHIPKHQKEGEDTMVLTLVGDDLSSYYSETPNPSLACKLLSLYLSIFEELHSRWVVHNDVHPRNLILRDLHTGFLIDFELSKHHPNQEGPFAGEPYGVAAYMGTMRHLGYSSALLDLEGLVYSIIRVCLGGSSLPWYSLWKQVEDIEEERGFDQATFSMKLQWCMKLLHTANDKDLAAVAPTWPISLLQCLQIIIRAQMERTPVQNVYDQLRESHMRFDSPSESHPAGSYIHDKGMTLRRSADWKKCVKPPTDGSESPQNPDTKSVVSKKTSKEKAANKSKSNVLEDISNELVRRYYHRSTKKSLIPFSLNFPKKIELDGVFFFPKSDFLLGTKNPDVKPTDKPYNQSAPLYSFRGFNPDLCPRIDTDQIDSFISREVMDSLPSSTHDVKDFSALRKQIKTNGPVTIVETFYIRDPADLLTDPHFFAVKTKTSTIEGVTVDISAGKIPIKLLQFFWNGFKSVADRLPAHLLAIEHSDPEKFKRGKKTTLKGLNLSTHPFQVTPFDFLFFPVTLIVAVHCPLDITPKLIESAFHNINTGRFMNWPLKLMLSLGRVKILTVKCHAWLTAPVLQSPYGFINPLLLHELKESMRKCGPFFQQDLDIKLFLRVFLTCIRHYLTIIRAVVEKEYLFSSIRGFKPDDYLIDGYSWDNVMEVMNPVMTMWKDAILMEYCQPQTDDRQVLDHHSMLRDRGSLFMFLRTFKGYSPERANYEIQRLQQFRPEVSSKIPAVDELREYLISRFGYECYYDALCRWDTNAC
eukprot:gnl/Dysnectes_brevis/6843_a10921_333.p1 GENE.gnl/Dysnectes_brevis/6843_a10921_333~~gnl/Dysnectes_brevis/6843_a10921_333.p1  ORF type:complete len:790 (+),score=25.79 gnl/Dysnectes_brevis/6843_a10921_333:53-2422(+)